MTGSCLQVCAICGEEKSEGQVWFLLAATHQEDKLLILRWESEIAERRGIHCLCCPAHVEEMVVHWMSLGGLDFPFAVVETNTCSAGNFLPSLPWVLEPDIRGARKLGELTVDRKSIGRILNENPESLQVILDELSDTLQRESLTSLARFESAARLHPGHRGS